MTKKKTGNYRILSRLVN